jgi:hypothetical protein
MELISWISNFLLFHFPPPYRGPPSWERNKKVRGQAVEAGLDPARHHVDSSFLRNEEKERATSREACAAVK